MHAEVRHVPHDNSSPASSDPGQASGRELALLLRPSTANVTSIQPIMSGTSAAAIQRRFL